MRTVTERNILTQGSGFNCKQYHCPPLRAQLTYGAVRGLMFGNTVADTPDYYAYVKRMSAVAKLKQQFMIKNQSVGLPLDFTIHLVKVKDYSLVNETNTTLQNFADYFARTFQSPTTPFGTVEGRIPAYYMTETPDLANYGDLLSGTRHTSASVLNQTKLEYSGLFKQAFEVVESFRKVIAPGDFWNFSHTHVTGNGIDMRQVSRQTLVGELNTQPSSQINDIIYKTFFPFTYGVVFEAKGKMGELYYVPALGSVDTYIGTTSTAYSYEYKTSAYYVTDSNTSGQDPVAKVPHIIETVTQSALPTATGDGALGLKPFTLPFSSVANSQLDETNPVSVGRGYIPMTSSAVPSSRIFEGAIPG